MAIEAVVVCCGLEKLSDSTEAILVSLLQLGRHPTPSTLQPTSNPRRKGVGICEGKAKLWDGRAFPADFAEKPCCRHTP